MVVVQRIERHARVCPIAHRECIKLGMLDIPGSRLPEVCATRHRPDGKGPSQPCAPVCRAPKTNDQDVAHQVIMATSDCVPQTTNCCSRPRHQLAELWANAPSSESVVHDVRQEQHCHRFCTGVASPRRPARRHGQQFSTEKGHRQSRQADQQFRETCGMHGKRKRHSPDHHGNLNLWCRTQRPVARSAPQGCLSTDPTHLQKKQRWRRSSMSAKGCLSTVRILHKSQTRTRRPAHACGQGLSIVLCCNHQAVVPSETPFCVSTGPTHFHVNKSGKSRTVRF